MIVPQNFRAHGHAADSSSRKRRAAIHQCQRSPDVSLSGRRHLSQQLDDPDGPVTRRADVELRGVKVRRSLFPGRRRGRAQVGASVQRHRCGPVSHRVPEQPENIRIRVVGFHVSQPLTHRFAILDFTAMPVQLGEVVHRVVSLHTQVQRTERRRDPVPEVLT
jgi:hypothetical protein